MINQSKPYTSMSTQHTDIRYEKALKQINKLMGVNRQIKLQSDQAKFQTRQIMEKHHQLIKHYQQLEYDHTQLYQNTNGNSARLIQLQQYCEQLKIRISKSQQQLQKNQEYYRLKIQRYQKQKQQFKNIYSRLEQKYRKQKDNFDIQISNFQTQLHEKQNFNHLLREEISKLKITRSIDEQNHKVKIEECKKQYANKLQIENESLANKLKISQDWAKNLSEQYHKFKQKMIIIQTRNVQDENKQKKIPLKNCRDGINFLHLQWNKKLCRIEKQSKQWENKYRRIKYKYKQICNKEKNLQNNIQIYKNKLNQFEQLMHKQQNKIKYLMKDYDNELKKVIQHQKSNKSIFIPHLYDEQSLRNQLYKKNHLIEYLENKCTKLQKAKIKLENEIIQLFHTIPINLKKQKFNNYDQIIQNITKKQKIKTLRNKQEINQMQQEINKIQILKKTASEKNNIYSSDFSANLDNTPIINNEFAMLKVNTKPFSPK